ncbi:signal peptidase II [Actinocorallia populi]|uniref:signal peptidase II n=1 Tax=Actinocorallia populi TaxID=2079200 RepID=UPI0018E59F8D|nr:signal peptidase II [Actinocorallia populi]
MRRYGWMLALAAAVLLVDQASKYWAVSALSDGERIPVIPELIQLRLTYNAGAAFSIGSGMTWIFTLTAAATVAAILFMGRRLRTASWTVVLGALLGGATTHLLDRLFREPGFAQGHVVDFIDYGPFVGNIADIVLFASCALLLLLNLRGIPFEEEADQESASEPARTSAE